MAVNKSNILTNVANGTMLDKSVAGAVQYKHALLTLADAAADNDVHLMFKIPVDADILSLKFASDDLGTTGLFNVGFYKADPGDPTAAKITAATNAIDEDALATSIDVKTAAVALTEIRYEVQGIETIGKKAWELAGLSAKPDYEEFYVAITNSEATTAGGDVTLQALFV